MRQPYVYALFIILAVFAISISACTPTEEVCPVGSEGCGDADEPAPNEPTTNDPVTPPTPPADEVIPPEIPDVPPEPIIPEQALPAEIKTLFEKAETNTKGYTYKFQGPPNPTEYYDVLVKGDKMKVLLPKGSSIIKTNNFDTVYIDLSANTAEGYCEREPLYCKGGPAITTDAAKWRFKTPLDWIPEITTGTLMGSETLLGRPVYRLEYIKDDLQHVAFIDKFFGIPILVKIGEDIKGVNDKLTIYEYKSVSVNTVTDNEVNRPE
ncbi:MAG: hypothetical protein ABIJ21_00985 [Nanoarchaeota archaeon]